MLEASEICVLSGRSRSEWPVNTKQADQISVVAREWNKRLRGPNRFLFRVPQHPVSGFHEAKKWTPKKRRVGRGRFPVIGRKRRLLPGRDQVPATFGRRIFSVRGTLLLARENGFPLQRRGVAKAVSCRRTSEYSIEDAREADSGVKLAQQKHCRKCLSAFHLRKRRPRECMIQMQKEKRARRKEAGRRGCKT